MATANDGTPTEWGGDVSYNPIDQDDRDMGDSMLDRILNGTWATAPRASSSIPRSPDGDAAPAFSTGQLGGYLDKLLNFNLQRDALRTNADLIRQGRLVGYGGLPYGYVRSPLMQDPTIRLLVIGGLVYLVARSVAR